MKRSLVEEVRIHCAWEHFKAISADTVLYEVMAAMPCDGLADEINV